MAIDLPDVVQDWTANVSEYLAAMQSVIEETRAAAEACLEAAAAVKTLQGVIDSLHGKTIDLGIDSAGAAAANDVAAALEKIAVVAPGAAAGLQDASSASAGLAGAEAILAHELPDISADLMQQTALLRTMAESMTVMARDTADASADLMMQTQILADLRDNLLQTAGATYIYNAANQDAGNGARNANNGFALLGNGLRVTGTALHWIVAGTAEFLAVAVPAAIALAAGLLVAADAAQNVQAHITALNTAVSATGGAFAQSTGQVLGLGNALSNAQQAAAPGVYTILGAAINIAKTSMGGLTTAGLQVVQMWDEFAARVTVDMQGMAGSQVHGMLSNMVSDLQMFGQVLGNIGHALLNFASAMPGLAQRLLMIATAISQVILAISSLPSWILTAVFAIEEFYRWGGLALNLLIRLAGAPAAMAAWYQGANFIRGFGTALLSVVSAGGRALIWAGTMVNRLAGVSQAAGEAGTAMAEAGAGIATFAAEMSPMEAALAALAVVGFGALAYAIITAKTATENWIAASDQAVAKAGDMQKLNTISNQMQQTMIKQAQAASQAAAGQRELTSATTAADPANRAYVASIGEAQQSTAQLQQHFLSLGQTALTVMGNAQNLASVLHIGVPAAMMAASAAGVNLQASMARGSQAFAIAVQQIKNYFSGMAGMGAPMGVLGNDVMVLGIQSQLASSKVQQLNSAWSAWIQSVTGGVAAIAQFQTALAGMSQSVAGTSSLLSGAISSVSRAAQASSYTLRGFGQNAMQSWQQFTSAINTGDTALASMRTGMAENVVTFGQYKNVVRGMVGEMAPFTQGNKAAVSMLSQLAQEAGFKATTSLKTLEQQAGVTGKAARDMAVGGILQASIQMGNMAKVAQNLSAVVNSQLDQSMASAIIQTSKLGATVQQYATDLGNSHTPASKLVADEHAIAAAMTHANSMIAQGSKGLNAATQASNHAATANKHLASAEQVTAAAAKLVGDSAKGTSGDMHTLSDAAAATAASLDKHHISAKIAAISTFDLQGKVQSLTGTEQGSQGTRDTVNQSLQKMQTQSQLTANAVFALQGKITTAAGAALTAAGKMLTLGTAMTAAGNQAQTAAGKVYALQTAIAGLQSKTITLTTNMVTTSTHRAAGGPVAAGMPYTVGELGPELFVPFQSGMILPAPETRQFTSGGGSQGGGSFGGGGMQAVHVHAVIDNHVNMDGQEVWRGQQRRTLQYNVRNGGAQSGAMAPGKGG